MLFYYNNYRDHDVGLPDRGSQLHDTALARLHNMRRDSLAAPRLELIASQVELVPRPESCLLINEISPILRLKVQQISSRGPENDSMASFGQLTNALFSASQETSIGLANLHFDFAVIKVEAPSEYQGLGQALSKRRRDTAENGPLHITARKLGALFEGVMPKVPDLIQAYGKRASEIASSPEATPQDSARHSVFAEHVGMDGSTIWAAATSGGETVSVHLLACMLARIWAREEAVSIWQELVEARKTQLRVDTADISVIAKSRIDLSREQLDAWDSGAR